jgi:hypothetical protein
MATYLLSDVEAWASESVRYRTRDRRYNVGRRDRCGSFLAGREVGEAQSVPNLTLEEFPELDKARTRTSLDCITVSAPRPE